MWKESILSWDRRNMFNKHVVGDVPHQDEGTPSRWRQDLTEFFRFPLVVLRLFVYRLMSAGITAVASGVRRWSGELRWMITLLCFSDPVEGKGTAEAVVVGELLWEKSAWSLQELTFGQLVTFAKIFLLRRTIAEHFCYDSGADLQISRWTNTSTINMFCCQRTTECTTSHAQRNDQLI